ncbi:hypothetical protein [uncultured Nitratireductor sp.]|uniref:hypothetical protein n=1 Tax=uncultured Nitratireductor sp. TaxID=520953 RepID=UPI0025D6B6C8|nr:hypothetical protein [uncultured Nitratireductor sp.]
MPALEPAEAAALIKTILETVSHRAIHEHPAGIAHDTATARCRRLILTYLTTLGAD